MTTTEERLSRLEGAYEQVASRLDSIDARLNTLLTVTLGLWATLTAGIIAGLIALFITR